jgi:ubiquinone/menaquinone biosynthesis C-methylase UbiE
VRNSNTAKKGKGMADPRNARQELASTYVMQNRSNKDEVTRLAIQDQMITTGMGGVLPEQPDPARFQQVLDLGCGTGGWLIELAKAYPTAQSLVGVDINDKILDYARSQAQAQRVSDRVQFHAMDALQQLTFPANSFDLINQRFGSSYLRTWEWPHLLGECQRLLRAGGVIRLVEANMMAKHSSPALVRLNQLLLQTLGQAGHFFNAQDNSIYSHFPRLLQQHGFQQIQIQARLVEYRAGTPEGQHFIEDMQLTYKATLPFMRRWIRVPDDYEAIYQQTLVEMRQPDFVAAWELVTTWGYR